MQELWDGGLSCWLQQLSGDGEKAIQDNLSEWLRRQTRNLLGFARAGSNPAVVAFFVLFFMEFGEYVPRNKTENRFL